MTTTEDRLNELQGSTPHRRIGWVPEISAWAAALLRPRHIGGQQQHQVPIVLQAVSPVISASSTAMATTQELDVVMVMHVDILVKLMCVSVACHSQHAAGSFGNFESSEHAAENLVQT